MLLYMALLWLELFPGQTESLAGSYTGRVLPAPSTTLGSYLRGAEVLDISGGTGISARRENSLVPWSLYHQLRPPPH